MEEERRKLNAFETFFATHNIRFAMLVLLFPSSTRTTTTTKQQQQQQYRGGSNKNVVQEEKSCSDNALRVDGKRNDLLELRHVRQALSSCRLGKLQLVVDRHHKGERERTTTTTKIKDDDDDDDLPLVSTTTTTNEHDLTVLQQQRDNVDNDNWYLYPYVRHPALSKDNDDDDDDDDDNSIHRFIVDPHVVTDIYFGGRLLDERVYGCCSSSDTTASPHLQKQSTTTTTTTPAATGPLHVEVLYYDQVDVDDHDHNDHPAPTALAAVCGVLVNSNHALCDGRGLMYVIEQILLKQTTASPNDYFSISPSESIAVPEDWKDLVGRAVGTTEQWCDEPPYLGIVGDDRDDDDDGTTSSSTLNVLSMNELTTITAATSAATVTNTTTTTTTHATRHDTISLMSNGCHILRSTTSVDAMANLKQLLRMQKMQNQRHISLTALLVAMLMKSIALEYYAICDRVVDDNDTIVPTDRSNIGVSVMVDLRPFLDGDKGDLVAELPQAFGTVTLLLPSKDFLPFRQQDVESTLVSSSDSPLLLHLAESLTQQLQQRIQRREALRSALALTQGEFDETPPSSTLELSNLGVCSLPSSAELYATERFDDYDGVSCLVHSESHSMSPDVNDPSSDSITNEKHMASSFLLMRWCVSIGKGNDASLVHRIFGRVWADLELLGTTPSPQADKPRTQP